MILLITIPLAIAASLAWYLPCVKAQGDNRVLTAKDYWVIALKYGFLFTCLLIMLTEIIWDRLIAFTPLTGLAKDIAANFTRAALLEELFKFLGFKLAKRKYQLSRKIDYMLVAGLVGMTYGIFEKVALVSIPAVIVGSICPMHIMWQLNQGGHYFEYEKAKAAKDEAALHKEWRLAILLPFLFHGLWDSGLDIVLYLISAEGLPKAVQVIAAVFGLAMVVFGIIYAVKTVKKVRKIAREEPPAVPAAEASGA